MSVPKVVPKVLLHGEETNGEVSIVENVLPVGSGGPPLHRHDFDEVFHILEGELVFQLGDELVTKGPGEVVFAPRGAPHTLANQGETPARYVLTCTPAGFERHFARVEAEQAGTEPPEWALAPTPDVEVLGPPIGG